LEDVVDSVSCSYCPAPLALWLYEPGAALPQSASEGKTPGDNPAVLGASGRNKPKVSILVLERGLGTLPSLSSLPPTLLCLAPSFDTLPG